MQIQLPLGAKNLDKPSWTEFSRKQQIEATAAIAKMMCKILDAIVGKEIFENYLQQDRQEHENG